MTIPAGTSLTAGAYNLVVVVDAGGVVNESDLTTQTSSAPLSLSVAPPPDLSVATVTSIADFWAAGTVGDGDLAGPERWASRRRRRMDR